MHVKNNFDFKEKKWKKITEEEINKIFKGIFLDNIYIHEKLHAKLYFNEKTALVTSLNLLDSSIKNNIEIGCLLKDNEYKEVRKNFYEKYLVKQNKTIEEKIKLLEEKLNEYNKEKNYFPVEYENNIIYIKNNKFTLKCFLEQWMGRYEYQNPEEISAMVEGYDPETDKLLAPQDTFLLKFEITFDNDISYSKVVSNFHDLIKKYCAPIKYENQENNKTIVFSSDFISEYRGDQLENKPINLVLDGNDIRNVFFSKELNHYFNKYINHIVITLTKILYKGA